MRRILFLIAFVCSIAGQAQDIIVLNSGESIKGYKLDLTSADVIYYQLSKDDDTSLRKIARKDVMVIRLVDGTIYNPNEAKQQTTTAKTEKAEEVSNFPNIDLTNYHGYLLAEGNCVYVAANSDAEWEQYGVERIKQHLKRIGYWKVVDKPEQAHFILQFRVNLRGKDTGIIYARTRKSFAELPACTYGYNNIQEPETALFYFTHGGEERDVVYKNIDKIFKVDNWNNLKKAINTKRSMWVNDVYVNLYSKKFFHL